MIKEQLITAQGNDRVFGLLAGAAGIGKTTQATTFPKEETAIISVEDGLLSIKGSGYFSFEVENYEDLVEVLEKRLKSPEYRWIKYLLIDSLSEIYDLIKRTAKLQFSQKENFARNDEIKDKVFYCIRLARSLDMNCFFTCHVKQEKNGVVLEDELAFDGKMPTELKKMFDTVVLMKEVVFDNAQPSRAFILSPMMSKIAKARVSPWLGITIGDYEEPNLYKLVQKLLGIANKGESNGKS